MENEDDFVEKWKEVLALQDIASERSFLREQKTGPFLVEPFCAEVAWMGKSCPMYPFTASNPSEICRFLTQDGYENYRCPAVCENTEIFQPIYERGTPEQKKALEHLADMYVRYSQNPAGEDGAIWLKITGFRVLYDAERIYRKLGLEEKAKEARRVYEKLTFRPAEDPDEVKRKFEEWEKAQAEIDKKSLPKIKKLLASLEK